MFNFCHKNFIKYGWGNQTYGHRTSSDAKFWIKYGRCDTEPLDFRSECRRAVKLINETTEKKILVHFSGGIDSEIICKSFYESNIPFEVCIWVYDNNLNIHDIAYALKFCKEYNIRYNILQLDIVKFIKFDMFRVCRQKYFCHSWWSNMAKYAISQNDGYQILGDGHVNFNHDPLGLERSRTPSYIPPVLLHTKYYQGEDLEAKTYKVFGESQHAEILSYMEQTGKEGCSGFFYYTPELLLSFIRDEFIQNWLEYCDLKNLSEKIWYPMMCHETRVPSYVTGRRLQEELNINCTLDIRPFVKYKYWHELQLRPKFTGIDKIRPMIIKQLDRFGKKYPHNSPGNEMVFIPAEDFIRGLECE
jgi:hypothetical protein